MNKKNSPIYLTGKPAYFEYLIRLIENIDGSIVELGVGAAKSAKLICNSVLMQGRLRDYWGFDSFQGFPQPSYEDGISILDRIEKGYSVSNWCRNKKDAIKKITGFCDFPKNNLHLVTGFYSNELFSKQYNKTSIAFLHFDCDLYESYNLGLAFFIKYVPQGGIIVFDEYTKNNKNIKWPGAVKAINEWLVTTGLDQTDLSEVILIRNDNELLHKYFWIKRSIM